MFRWESTPYKVISKKRSGARGLQDDEQRVPADLELRPLVRSDGILDSELGRTPRHTDSNSAAVGAYRPIETNAFSCRGTA
jgi:hypothetical protein